jgi:hypothetical protein
MSRETSHDEDRLAFQETSDGDREVAVRCDQVFQAAASARRGFAERHVPEVSLADEERSGKGDRFSSPYSLCRSLRMTAA